MCQKTGTKHPEYLKDAGANLESQFLIFHRVLSLQFHHQFALSVLSVCFRVIPWPMSFTLALSTTDPHGRARTLVPCLMDLAVNLHALSACSCGPVRVFPCDSVAGIFTSSTLVHVFPWLNRQLQVIALILSQPRNLAWTQRGASGGTHAIRACDGSATGVTAIPCHTNAPLFALEALYASSRI